MKSRDFCYWLQGYFEIRTNDDENVLLNARQIETIKKHLAMVFRHEIDPSFGKDNADLSKIHEGGSPAFDPKPLSQPSDLIARC